MNGLPAALLHGLIQKLMAFGALSLTCPACAVVRMMVQREGLVMKAALPFHGCSDMHCSLICPHRYN